MRFLLGLLLVGVLGAVESLPPISITLRPVFSFAPSTIHVTVRIPRQPENRAYCVWITSANYTTSSCRDLEGSRAPVTREVEFKSVPAGAYQAQASIYRLNGHLLSPPTTFEVLESVPR